MEDSVSGDYYHPPTFRPVVATRSDTADCSRFDGCPGLGDAFLYSTFGVVEPELVAIDPSMEPVGKTSIDTFGLTQLHEGSVLSGIIRANWHDEPTGVGSMEGCAGSFGFTGDQYRHIDEEEGVSVILSNCESLWNLSNVSSGESENNHIITTITPYKHSPNPNEVISLASKRSKEEGGIHISFTNPAKRPRPGKKVEPRSSNIDFRREKTAEEADPEAIAHVKEMIYRAAAFRPVPLAGEEEVEKPRRKNVRISSDPQTVAARHRRERISERLRVLQMLVPGGSKMDTASMLDEAANYLKFLKSQVIALENSSNNSSSNNRLNLKNMNVVGTPFSTFLIPPLFSHAAQIPNDCSNRTPHDDIIM